jgi:serine/threonine protein kinase
LTKVKGKLGRKKTDGLEDDIAAMGSVHWMAPEQMEDTDTVSKASDIYR